MHKISLFILLTVLSTAKALAGSDTPFKKHNFEISFSPGVEAHFVTHSNREPSFKQVVDQAYKPYFGCNIDVAYIYRPIRYLGVSAGLDVLLQGTKIIAVFPDYTGYSFNGYLGAPALLHGYVLVKRVELELTSGPEFLFPFVAISNYQYNHETNYSNATEMKQYSMLAWVVQATVNIPIKNSMAFSIGPDIRFIGMHPLNTGPYYNTTPHQIDYLVACKIGFRFGGNCYKASKPVEEKR